MRRPQDNCTGLPVSDTYYNASGGSGFIGFKYMKWLYREYTDETFQVCFARLAEPPAAAESR